MLSSSAISIDGGNDGCGLWIIKFTRFIQIISTKPNPSTKQQISSERIKLTTNLQFLRPQLHCYVPGGIFNLIVDFLLTSSMIFLKNTFRLYAHCFLPVQLKAVRMNGHSYLLKEITTFTPDLRPIKKNPTSVFSSVQFSSVQFRPLNSVSNCFFVDISSVVFEIRWVESSVVEGQRTYIPTSSLPQGAEEIHLGIWD